MSKSWFAAHIILCVKYTEHRQNSIPLWENVVLIAAESEEEAFAKAECYGRKKETKGEEATFTWAGKPARWVFGGVRKLTTCDDPEERPDDGTEITYTQMKVRSPVELKKLLDGEDVGVRYIEQYREGD